MIGVATSDVWRTDLATLDWTEITTTEEPPVPLHMISAATEPDGSVIVLAALGTKNILRFRPSEGSWECVDCVGVQHPMPSRNLSFAQGYDRFVMRGVAEPWDLLGGLSGDVWVYDFTEQAFSVASVADDPADGRPIPRRGAGTFAGHPVGWPVFFGGELGDGSAGPTQAWRIDESSPDQWQHRTWTSGTSPGPRTGAVTWDAGACASLVLFGGQDPSSGDAVRADYWSLVSCSSDGSGCEWIEADASVSRPTHPVFAAGTRVDSEVLVFGGHDGSASTNAVFRADACHTGGPGPFTAVSVAPDPSATPGEPTPRMGHSLTYAFDTTSAERLIAFGGASDPPLFEPKNDAWFLTRTTTEWAWERIDLPVGPTPLPRAYHVAAWDRRNNQLLVYGGYAKDGTDRILRSDLWALVVVD